MINIIGKTSQPQGSLDCSTYCKEKRAKEKGEAELFHIYGTFVRNNMHRSTSSQSGNARRIKSTAKIYSIHAGTGRVGTSLGNETLHNNN